MRIIVTGGGGFIGSHIVEHHLAKGDQVLVVDDLSSGSSQNIALFKANPAFRFAKANINNWSNLQKVVSWAQRIYHFAAIVGVYRVLAEPINVFNTNILGCEKILRAASIELPPPQIIIASSSSVYGHSDKSAILGLEENDDLIIKAVGNPLRNYGLSKIISEEFATMYYANFNIPILIVRIFNTIGPRQTGAYGMVVPRFVAQACTGQPITIFGDGTQTRSFCDVRDTVEDLTYLADNPQTTGEIINIGNDNEIAINDLADLIVKLAQSSSTIKHIHYKEAYGIEFTDISQRKPNLTKLRSFNNFKYKWTLAQTVDDLISRFRKII